VAFSPDGKQLVSGGLDGTVRVWDPVGSAQADPFRVLPISVPLGGCAFAPDGRTFIALDSSDGSVSLWDTAALEEREKLSFLGTNNVAAAWDTDGHTLALSDRGGNLRIWNLSTRGIVTNCIRDGQVSRDLSFSGKHTLLGFLPLGKPGDLRPFTRFARLWDTRDWLEMTVPAVALEELIDAAVSPDGHTLVVASADGVVAWWDLSSGRCLGRIGNQYARSDASVVFSPDGRMVAISEAKAGITLWDAAARQPTVKIHGNLRNVLNLAFTRDGQRLLTSGAEDEDAVRLLDPGSQRYVACLPAPEDRYVSVMMSPDETTLMAIGRSGTAVFWQAPSWEEIARRENQETDAR
jgi:WD40 repeat protein